MGRNFSKGLKVIDTRTETIVRSYQYDGGPHSLNDNNVFAICRTAAGDIYIGTGCGLMRYNRQTDSFDIIPELVGIFVYDIKEDTSGNLWLATYVCGVFVMMSVRKNGRIMYTMKKMKRAFPTIRF